ncbi:MAG: hypothetical protein MN733_20615 [Nitrososphaera sp.]|nr:hypothetical protein [Nitrososphaera sp.]
MTYRFKMLWVSRPENRKTGCIPTAYIGDSYEAARASCKGCALLEKRCYAWNGAMMKGFSAVLRTNARDPERYDYRNAIFSRNRKAKAIRFGAIGDPARADRVQLLKAVDLARSEGLSVIGYTHHWRNEPITGMLKRTLMASCNMLSETPEAIARGWKPAVVIPWDHKGNTFDMPDGGKGLVCPAQTKHVTCNDCRMCDPNHPVWDAGKIQAIGFLDHSPKARFDQSDKAFGKAKARKLPTVNA